MDLISVIVPVYKVEKYLRKCVDSILAQTYTNLEIILVDDGSPDNCGKICDEYAKKDNRITVIHQQNGGLSAARNAGLDIATGEYIGFVDSDDYIEPEMYEKLYNTLVMNNADMSICGMRFYNEKGDRIVKDSPLTDRVFTKNELFCELQKDLYWFYVNANPKLYRAEVFENLRFSVGKLYEDNWIIHYVFDRCSAVAVINLELYNVIIRSGSITHSGVSLKQLDDIDAFTDRISFFNSNGYDEFIVPAKSRLLNQYRRFRQSFKPANQNEKQTIELYDHNLYTVFKTVRRECNLKTRLFFECRPVYMLLFKVKSLLKGE